MDRPKARGNQLLTIQRLRRVNHNPEDPHMGQRLDKSLGEKAEACITPANDSAATGSDPSQPQAGDCARPPIEPGSGAATSGSPKVGALTRDGGETIVRSGVEAVDESPNYAAEAIASPDGDAANETQSEPAVDSAAPAPQARSLRFALLAATIALAAAVGSLLGSLSAAGIVRLFAADATSYGTADARDVLQAMRAQLAGLSMLKANVAGATRNANTQFAKIADRLDRLARAEADPTAKLTHIADTVDRLDKRSAAAAETTGSITPSTSPPPAQEPKPTDRILNGWIVQGVHNGRALVESRYGGVFVVGSGSFLPGLGRVQAVKRQDGEWVVVTARGLITSGR
jgi:hypothetical protein